MSALLERLAHDGCLCKFLSCIDGGDSNQILENMDWGRPRAPSNDGETRVLQSFQFAHEVMADVDHRQSVVDNREDEALVQHYKVLLLYLPTSCNLQDIGCLDTTVEDRVDMLREVELSVKDDTKVTKCV